MVHKKRSKSIRKSRAIALTNDEKSYSKVPHTLIFTRPGVGHLVKQLGLDVREMFGPYTASKLHVTKRNVLKDFVNIAGPLNVTHLMYLTHSNENKRAPKHAKENYGKRFKQTSINADSDLANCEHKVEEVDDHSTNCGNANVGRGGGVYFHLIRVPHGPSLTFRVLEYSLKRDILTLIRRIFTKQQYTNPPLLVMTGFGMNKKDSASGPAPHLRLIVDMFQNLLPPLNVQKLKLNSVRRVLLVSREVNRNESNDVPNSGDQDVIYLRHYHIRTEDRSMSRPLRRLGLGGAKLKPRQSSLSSFGPFGGIGPSGTGKSSGVPNLAKYTSMDEFLTKAGLLSDSALSDALSDMEEVDLVPINMSANTNPTSFHLSSASTFGDRKRKLTRKSSSTAPVHGLKHLTTSKKATIRLTEIGPRLCLSLIKIEEGVNTGSVLYHRWHSRSLTEIVEQSERLRKREELRASRRSEHEARRSVNEAVREAHRDACLEGMKRAGNLVAETNSKLEDSETESVEDIADMPLDDDIKTIDDNNNGYQANLVETNSEVNLEASNKLLKKPKKRVAVLKSNMMVVRKKRNNQVTEGLSKFRKLSNHAKGFK